jgi:hypothetical protein
MNAIFHENGYPSNEKLNGQTNQSSNKISGANVTSLQLNRPLNLPPDVDQEMPVGNYLRHQMPNPNAEFPTASSSNQQLINAYMNQDNGIKNHTTMINQPKPTARIIHNIIGIPPQPPPTPIFYSGNEPSRNHLIYPSATSHIQQRFILLPQQKQDSILPDPSTSENIVIIEPTFQGPIQKKFEKKSKISEIGKQIKQKSKHEIHLLEDDELEPVLLFN